MRMRLAPGTPAIAAVGRKFERAGPIEPRRQMQNGVCGRGAVDGALEGRGLILGSVGPKAECRRIDGRARGEVAGGVSLARPFAVVGAARERRRCRGGGAAAARAANRPRRLMGMDRLLLWPDANRGLTQSASSRVPQERGGPRQPAFTTAGLTAACRRRRYAVLEPHGASGFSARAWRRSLRPRRRARRVRPRPRPRAAAVPPSAPDRRAAAQTGVPRASPTSI